MPPSSPHRMSPYRRQHLLVQRLAFTHEHERQRTHATSSSSASAAAAAVAANSMNTAAPSTVTSRKRSFANITAPDAAQSPLKPQAIKSDPRVGDDNNNLGVSARIDEYGMWEEVSTIIPLLPYGEESNALLSALLGYGCCSSDIHTGETKPEGERIHQQSQHGFSNLARALERMLRTRNVMRQGRQRNIHQLSSNSKSSSSTLMLEQKLIKHEHQQITTTDNMTRTEILPWNVLLRITIRMASFVANQLLQPLTLSKSLDCRDVATVLSNGSAFLNANNTVFISSETSAKSPTIQCNGNSQNDGDDDDTTRFQSSVIHSLLQILDIALAGLRVLSRMQSQQRQEISIPTKSMDKTTTPTKSTPLHPSPLQIQVAQRKQRLPVDRMMHDWKGNTNNMHASIGRDVWGPSRYAFLKDIDVITNILVEGVTNGNDGGGEGGSCMGVNIIEEWHEQVNALVTSLDECIRAEEGLPHEQMHQPPTQLGISPSLLRYGTKSFSSPSKSPSMASITRAHVERVGSRIKAETSSSKKRLIRSSNFDSNAISVNLQNVLDKERTAHSPIPDDADELEEAYRMAVAVGSSRRGDNVRETIERRLEILVQKLNDNKSRGINKGTSVNIDGAGAFLEVLLRTLIQPSDPKVWLRFLEESGGKETPLMLRRGRTLIVSFLIEIRAPGWKDAARRLEPSPVPSYLGYLSSREEFEACENKQQHAMMSRSSYFLPAVERGQTTIPPSPIVTEVGLSLCIKNFLQKDTQESQYFNRAGAILFRKGGPQHFSESSRDHLLDSIQSPLPHVNDLTCDLFDLTLRFAVNDDSDHGKMSIPLRLVTPSASESLSIVLQAASDHLDWLSTTSISSRYRFILQHIIQTLQCSQVSSLRVPRIDDYPYPDDEGFAIWSRRATFVVETTDVEGRSRIANSTTKLMALLCSRTNNKTQGASFPRSSPYAGLQLRQSSNFWSEIDKNAIDIPSNIMARILDLNFAVRYLLPLSYQCALLLASSSLPSQHMNSASAKIQGCESLPSLVKTLCALLDVLAMHEVLHDCIHVGWSIQMIALSVSYFVFGEDFHWRERESKTLTDCDSNSDDAWESLSYELNRLYCAVWGRDWQMCNSKGSPASDKKCIHYESIGRGGNGVAMLVLMPSFDVFIASLIEFSCCLHLPAESDGVKGLCQFIANVLFDRYAYVHKVCPYPKSGYYKVDHPREQEFNLIFYWIDTFSSKMQDVICASMFSGGMVNKKYDKAEEESITRTLHDVITPVLRCLHKHILRRLLISNAPRREIIHDSSAESSELVASIFIRLYKQEAEKFLTKPSPAKTRKWNVYRRCLEMVFTLTPPDILFACSSHPALTDHVSKTLSDIWTQYGECDLSHSISIMVAASLHVNACATYPKDSLLLRPDDVLLQTKQLHSNFSSCAKSCILSTIHSNSQTTQSYDECRKNINYLLRFVQRELALRGGTDVALEWWNEISVDVLTLLKNTTIKIT